ncbi:MAG TPA: VWA domain-containing protein [Terriglobia bacterium]|nr:VWA domain-containing protein [Terriglobia bacterium]
MQKKTLVFGSLLLGLLFLVGQTIAEMSPEKGEKKPKKEPDKVDSFTFKVPVDVVVVNAMVTDKKGNPVKDLTVNDFKVYEDGKPQPIHTFTLESYKVVRELLATAPKKEVEGEPKPAESATSQRYFSLVIDDLNSPVMDQFYRSVEAMKQFVANQVLPGDLVMIYAVSGRAVLPFTSDKQALLQYLSELHKKLNLIRTGKSDCPQMTDLQAQRITNEINDLQSMEVALMEYCSCSVCPPNDDPRPIVRSAARQQYEEDRHRRQVTLASLRQLVQSLHHFEGKKLVILFSPGFIAQDIEFEIQEVVERSLRSGVVFNVVDARGLYTVGLEASDQVNVPDATLLGKKIGLLSSSKSAQSEPLEQISLDTGGIFYHNNNDLYAGMKQIAERQTYSYVLTYASPNIRNAGRYHKIKLEVSRPDVEVSYRKGYYEPKEVISLESRKKEDIQEAMWAPGNVNQIPIQMSHNFYQLDDNRYQLSLLTLVEMRRVKFLDEESRHKNLVSLVMMILDEQDRYVDGVEKNIEFSLSDAGYAQMVNNGITLKLEVAVPPGRYKVKAVVREGVETKMGALTRIVEVP